MIERKTTEGKHSDQDKKTETIDVCLESNDQDETEGLHTIIELVCTSMY